MPMSEAAGNFHNQTTAAWFCLWGKMMTTTNLGATVTKVDSWTFEFFYRANLNRFTDYAARLLNGDREAAEDAAQEAMIATWQNASRMQHVELRGPWTKQVIRHKTFDWIRKNRKMATNSDVGEALLNSVPDASAGPDELAENSDAVKRLWSALSLLPLDQRRAIWLCYYESKSLAEISAIERCPENTVKTRLFHGRMKLKNSGLLER
jgi:RNA polymerase sigma-70 factor, ECF subfamily